MLIWICTGRRAGRFAQVFALYQDPEELPRGSTMVREGQLLHQKFLREMEQNRDVIVPRRTGAEGGPGRGRRENGGDSLHRGGRAHRLRPGTGGDGGGMGRAVSQPRGIGPMFCPAPTAGTRIGASPLLAPTFCGSWRRAISAPTCPTSATRGSGTWCAWPGAGGGHPLQQPGPVPPPAQSHRRHVPGHPGQRRRGGLNLYRPFVGPAGTMEELVAHVEHFLELGGEKALCLGGDLDGCGTLAAGMQGRPGHAPACGRLWRTGVIPRQLLEDLFWNNLRRLI